MKKLPIFIMLFVVLLVPVNVYASEVVFNLSDFGALGDLGYGLIGGAQFNFDGSKYIIGNYENLTSSEKEIVKHFDLTILLFDYAEARKLPVPDQEGGYYQSLIFEKGIREAFNQYQYDLNIGAPAEAYAMTLSRQRFSDWAMYQDTWYSRYIESFNNIDIPGIEVNPDETYLNYINNINGDGFWWKNNNSSNLRYNASDLTWFDNGYGITNYLTYIGGIYTTNIVDINIISDNGVYSFSKSFSNSDILLSFGSNPYYQRGVVMYDSGYSYASTSNNWGPFKFTFSGSLSSVLNYIQEHFRNVNLYVDGEAWSLVSDPSPGNPVIPDFTDVINIDSEDPIGMIDLPNTTDYEGTFDITSLFDALKEAIAGASDNDNTTSGILTGDAVKDTFKDKAGELVGSIAVPIATVIDDSFPIEGSLNYPNIVPYAEPISNAFMGTTILAQLIDATQTVLPEPLILVFWGIVFILFIIGLIKILHK